MKTMKLLKIMLLLVVATAFVACEKNYYTEIDNTDKKLCANTWTNEYTEDNVSHKHVLMFNTDGTGQEIVSTTTYNGSSSHNESNTYTISWRWLDNNREGLYINRVADINYEIHNVWIRTNYLSGDIDGKQYTFSK
ncbi:MAG: hypothetical protein LIP08_15945 [Bacteroides sp.]|nr:hypothetical protein [Bacteroides sp.]